jgi:hypothetical protein
VGALAKKNRFTDDVERFLSLIRFEQREKLSEFGLDFVKMPVGGFESS